MNINLKIFSLCYQEKFQWEYVESLCSDPADELIFLGKGVVKNGQQLQKCNYETLEGFSTCSIFYK